MKINEICDNTSEDVQKYIEQHLFDKRGIMYSGINYKTGKPFEKEFITPVKTCRRAYFDPWSYWTYEDSVMTMGLFMDGLILKYEITKDSSCLSKAEEIWKVIKQIYSSSQIHGIGSFLRPYGGFEIMHKFMEPLGTDQASPLFSALYRYQSYAESKTCEDMKRVMLNTLLWYEQQGFEYFYYKTFIHQYAPEVRHRDHANSYYLPAIAWAAKNFPEDKRWERHLNERLGYFIDKQYIMYQRGSYQQPAFCWGSDMDVLYKILGTRFFEVFNEEILEEAYIAVKEVINSYSEPGIVRRICPESANPDFQASIKLDTDEGLGDGYSQTRHHGRSRPRLEIDFLLGLASVGYKAQECIRQATGLLALRSSVPADFTQILSEDYDRLPETVHLYACSVGELMVDWWRNYWLLRNIQKKLM